MNGNATDVHYFAERLREEEEEEEKPRPQTLCPWGSSNALGSIYWAGVIYVDPQTLGFHNVSRTFFACVLK
jgi:hypothetical protein